MIGSSSVFPTVKARHVWRQSHNHYDSHRSRDQCAPLGERLAGSPELSRRRQLFLHDPRHFRFR